MEISGQRLWISLVITVGFALIARRARGVTRSGALAGAAVSLSVTTAEPKLFLVLLTVFLVTLLATRWGKQRKQQLHAAEGARGRSASQVISNLGVAMLVIAVGANQQVLLALAVMSEVAADTCSSELGMAFPGKTVLLTSWKAVSPGVDGGISIHGTFAALASALVIASTGAMLLLITSRQAIVAAGAGFAGMIVDSFLGAVLERRGYLNNDAVNVLSTASAAALAWTLS
jgi:uncharacterized protein (TIGR00297 family)